MLCNFIQSYGTVVDMYRVSFEFFFLRMSMFILGNMVDIHKTGHTWLQIVHNKR